MQEMLRRWSLETPGGPVVKIPHFQCRIQSWVQELRSWCGQKKKRQSLAQCGGEVDEREEARDTRRLLTHIVNRQWFHCPSLVASLVAQW